MSILEGKTIMIVSDSDSQIIGLAETLEKYQMNVQTALCGSVSLADLQSSNVDIVILNHLHKGATCVDILNQLRGKILSKNIPIFAMVENTEDRINHALMLGAADFITPEEEIESIVRKIKIIFGQPDNFSGSSVIDVLPDTASTTKKGVRVFVVEDNSLLRNLLTTKLQASSFHFDFSVDGSDIIQKLLDFKPQVIILDLMLPVKDGFEILSDIKANKTLMSVPVVIFSNRDSQEDKQRVFALGADRYFVKAMTDLSVLIETIDELAS